MKMNDQNRITCGILCTFALLAGCDSSVRREALGGGAITPVKVTLLRDDAGGSDGGSSAADAGPKITEFGTVTGRITVNGTLPQLPDLVAKGSAQKDAICSANTIENESIQGTDGGLGNVFVFLKKVPNVDVPAPSEEAVEIDQKGCVFVPHAVLVQTGQPVIFKNSDPVAHNVKVQGRANTYDGTINPGGQSNYTFQLAESTPAGAICNFHSWMSAVVFPMSHPWGVITALDGTFRIENVPAGKMEFAIWHEKIGYVERGLVVDVPANGEASPIAVAVDAANLTK